MNSPVWWLLYSMIECSTAIILALTSTISNVSGTNIVVTSVESSSYSLFSHYKMPLLQNIYQSLCHLHWLKKMAMSNVFQSKWRYSLQLFSFLSVWISDIGFMLVAIVSSFTVFNIHFSSFFSSRRILFWSSDKTVWWSSEKTRS